jgi:hypothetical protein
LPRYREARSAVSAVREGIAVASVSKIERLGQATIAGRKIRGNTGTTSLAFLYVGATLFDPKVGTPSGFNRVKAKNRDLGGRRQIGIESVEEPVKDLRCAVGFDRDPGGAVAYATAYA